jgi:hypothetical protein
MKKLIVNILAGFILLGSLVGCAQTHYAWNNYDSKLYDHYKDPSQKEEFAIALKETLADAEASNRVPPGIYAEYGFLLYEQGDSLQAIQYYQKEYDMWPESRVFMSKMINSAQKRIKTQNLSAPVNTPGADPKQTISVQSEATK